MDSGRAPQRVFQAHSPDQITQASVNPRPPCPIARLPPPEHAKSNAVPSQDRFRLNHLDSPKQARPEPGHQHEKKAVAVTEPEPRWCPPQGDIELMPQKQILGFKPTARLEQVDDEQSEPMKESKHR
jgi:hypothetical protein